ncbi:NADH dehydrogenase [ubiquinone] 1 alpha subcomplex subunit 3-like [Alexandromys fortis]|uniref:NADH dehydrogenase [ubiquinone] 1 alpha subcomplex subunit 3-like n=1 Tax=Alexandromys fortis TaxID=100897 RepID=UPI0021534C48|nr:NADH dehydrogenase [ubiquinone] 1 alpha subcomplex subunit 3-like [Microtus fortis]
MTGMLSAFPKIAWAKEPVLVVSSICDLAIIMPIVSPYTKYAAMINQATPFNYPMAVPGNGKDPMCPATPRTLRGPSLEWLKNL